MKISRRAFHTAMLSTPALAQVADRKLVLPAWSGPSSAGDGFALTGRAVAAPALERAGASAEVLFGMVAGSVRTNAGD